jgi:hypothetical protein
VLDHGNGHRTRYLHLNAPPLPGSGDPVTRGQLIGHEGNSGNSIAPHLHFETRHAATTFTCGKDGTAVDPYVPSTYLWTTNPPSYAGSGSGAIRNMLTNASLETGAASPWAGWEPPPTTNLAPSCNWTPSQIRYVSWDGIPEAWPMPQIYRNDGGNAAQWQYVNNAGSPMGFTGTLSQWQACIDVPDPTCPTLDNLPGAAWNNLWVALNSQVPSSLLFGSDITHQQPY